MSAITRCPACSTVFKVVPDQLKVSGGWVRCGHCSEVFDAQAFMQKPPEPVPPGVPDYVAAPDSLPSSVSGEFKSSQAPVSEWTPDPDWKPDPAVDASGDSSLWGPSSVMPDVSFVRKANARAFWRRPAVRAALALGGVLLLATLGLQFALFERDRIATLQPAARPALQRLCQVAGCELSPLRQIDAILIDSSSFNKLRQDAYRLSVAIKNTGPLELAMPSLELALTDSQDQPVLRRVLGPAELGAGPTLAANGEFSGNLTIQINKASNPALAGIAGYRVLAFYP